MITLLRTSMAKDPIKSDGEMLSMSLIAGFAIGASLGLDLWMPVPPFVLWLFAVLFVFMLVVWELAAISYLEYKRGVPHG